MATIKDVAKEAGVSTTTVSYALKGDKKISEDTIQKVREVAKRLKYRPSGFARSLKSSRTNNIGVYLHGFGGPVIGDILQAIHDAVASKGYEIMVCSTRLSDKLLVERHVDGAIMFNSFISDKKIKNIADEDFPVVVMDRVIEAPNVSSVVIDNVSGGYSAVKQLLDSGYRKIALIAGKKDSYESLARLEGSKKALMEAGIDFGQTPIAYGYFEESGGAAAMQLLLESFPDITGLFCLNDEMAIGAMQTIKKSGRNIGGDIAVIGFDGISASSQCEPPLTTIRVDKRLWGYMAATTLLDRIENKSGERIIHLPTDTVLRQTVGRIEIGLA
jgi:LacI family transcriptional regulator